MTLGFLASKTDPYQRLTGGHTCTHACNNALPLEAGLGMNKAGKNNQLSFIYGCIHLWNAPSYEYTGIGGDIEILITGIVL